MNLENLIATLSHLSDDPDRAFFEYEEIKRAELDAKLAIDPGGWGAERYYIDSLKVFVEVFGENNYIKVGAVPSRDEEFSSMYNRFRLDMDRAKLKFTLQQAMHAKAIGDGVVILTEESKSAIRAFVEAIKVKLNEMDLAEAKRRALFSKLNAFLNEIDQNLTRTEAFFSFALQASRAAAEAGAEFKGVAERIDRVLDAIDGAKKWVESLPGFRKPEQLPAPPKQLEDHSS